MSVPLLRTSQIPHTRFDIISLYTVRKCHLASCRRHVLTNDNNSISVTQHNFQETDSIVSRVLSTLRVSVFGGLSLSVYLLSTLSRYDDVELVNSVDGCHEFATRLVVSSAHIRDESVEFDVCVLRNGSHVFRQTGEEGHFSTRRITAACENVRSTF